MKHDYKILDISKEFNGTTRNGDAFHGYVFVGETEGKQHTGELVYFCYVGNVKLEKDGFYRGSIVKQAGVDKNGKPKNDIFKDVQKIEGFGGLEDPFAPTHTQNAVDEREKAIRTLAFMKIAGGLTASQIQKDIQSKTGVDVKDRFDGYFTFVEEFFNKKMNEDSK